MKVLHVIPALSSAYGGPSRAVLEMCRALATQGVEAEIATTNADGRKDLDVPLGRKINYLGVSTYFFPRSLKTEYKFSWPLTVWLKKNIRNYDLLHIHSIFCHPTVVAARLARKFGIPYLVRPAGMLDDWPLKQKQWRKWFYFNFIERKTLEEATAIHYTSEEEKRVSEKLGYSTRGVVIPLGIHADSKYDTVEKGMFREKFPQCVGKKLVVFLSRLHPKKGLELLVAAISQLSRIRDDFIWVIAGQGEDGYEAALKTRIQKSGLSSRTLFTGFLEGEDKCALLKDADIFVLPSYQENFGIAVVEAMQHRLPVVISDRVDLAEEINVYGAGLIIPLQSEKISFAFQTLLDNEELRKKMGEAGKKLVREKFDSKKMAERLIDLYKEILTHETVGSRH